jgi:hypothetical protein
VFVDFTVSLLILPFCIVDFNSKMVKLTTKIVKSTDLWSKINLCTKSLILRKIQLGIRVILEKNFKDPMHFVFLQIRDKAEVLEILHKQF